MKHKPGISSFAYAMQATMGDSKPKLQDLLSFA